MDNAQINITTMDRFVSEVKKRIADKGYMTDEISLYLSYSNDPQFLESRLINYIEKEKKPLQKCFLLNEIMVHFQLSIPITEQILNHFIAFYQQTYKIPFYDDYVSNSKLEVWALFKNLSLNNEITKQIIRKFAVEAAIRETEPIVKKKILRMFDFQ